MCTGIPSVCTNSCYCTALYICAHRTVVRTSRRRSCLWLMSEQVKIVRENDSRSIVPLWKYSEPLLCRHMMAGGMRKSRWMQPGCIRRLECMPTSTTDRGAPPNTRSQRTARWFKLGILSRLCWRRCRPALSGLGGWRRLHELWCLPAAADAQRDWRCRESGVAQRDWRCRRSIIYGCCWPGHDLFSPAPPSVPQRTQTLALIMVDVAVVACGKAPVGDLLTVSFAREKHLSRLDQVLIKVKLCVHFIITDREACALVAARHEAKAVDCTPLHLLSAAEL